MLINTLEIIIPSTNVDISPPYTNNFLYSYPLSTMDLNKLTQYLTKTRNDDIKFTNLIISSTEEISTFTDLTFINIINTIKPFYNIFQYKYIQTNGDLLKMSNNIKFLMIKDDFLFRIQRFSLDNQINSDFFNLKTSYEDFANFDKASICFEILCLKESSYDFLNNILNNLITNYDNIKEFVLLVPKIYGEKINSINIRDLEFSNWILNFAYRKNIDQDIISYINTLTHNCGLEFKEYYEWNLRNKRIIFNYHNNLQIRYNKNHIFYGNQLIDYSGDAII